MMAYFSIISFGVIQYSSNAGILRSEVEYVLLLISLVFTWNQMS